MKESLTSITFNSSTVQRICVDKQDGDPNIIMSCMDSLIQNNFETDWRLMHDKIT